MERKIKIRNSVLLNQFFKSLKTRKKQIKLKKILWSEVLKELTNVDEIIKNKFF